MLILGSIGSTFLTSIYYFFAWVDYIIYNIAAVLFKVILALAEIDDIFTATQVGKFANRVYVVIGVLVLFKLVISAIQYLINPDSFEDKDKGIGGILKRTAISIVLIVVAPAVFNFMMSIQGAIIDALPRLVFGSNADTIVTNYKDDGAEELSYVVLSSFVQPREGKKGSMKKTKDGIGIYSIESFRDNVTSGCEDNSWWVFETAKNLMGISKPLENCNYNYMIIISTICGGFLCYILLSMALDVAIRVFKFGIIRILAPIPIAGYIFSKDKLTKFGKTTLTVYTDIFIRLLIIFFIIFMIQLLFGVGDEKRSALDILGIVSKRNGTGDYYLNAVADVAIIFGLLMFARNAPKFISELLGLPDVGSGDLAEMFKPAWQRAGGPAAALINPGVNAVSNWRNARAMGRSRGEALRRAAGGFGRGALDSVQGVMNGDDWGKMKNRLDASKKRSIERATTAKNRDNNRRDGQSRLDSIRSKIANLRNKLAFADDPQLQQEAEANYARDQARLQQMGDAYQRAIESGRLTGDAKDKALANYERLKNRLADRDAYIKNEKYKIQAQKVQTAAVNEHKTNIASNNARIGYIDQQLQNGGLTMDQRLELENERKSLLNQNATERAAINRLSHEFDIGDRTRTIRTNNQRVSEIESILAGTRSDEVLDRLSGQSNSIRESYATQISEIDRRLSATNLTAKQRTTLEASKTELIRNRDNEISTINSQIQEHRDALERERTEKRDAIVEAQREINSLSKQTKATELINEYLQTEIDISSALKDEANIQEEIRMVNEGIRQSGWRGKVDAYLGGTPVSGKGYIDLANLLSQSRSAIYTGESMTKMRQNADILVDENNEQITFKSKYIKGGEKGNRITYQDMLNIYNHSTSSGLTQDDRKKLREIGLSETMVESAWKDIEKKAGALYYTANVEEIVNPEHVDVRQEYIMRDPSLASDPTRLQTLLDNDPRYVDTTFDGEYGHVRLARHEVNSAIKESWNTFRDELVKSGVPAEIIGQLAIEFRRNPGRFMQRASEAHDLYSIVGKKIVDTQSSNSGNK